MEQYGLAILLRLLFAHFTADFILQTQGINAGKYGYKAGINGERVPVSRCARWGYLSYHSLIHAVLSYLLVAQWDYWIILPVIFTTHFAMDYLKSGYMKNNTCSFLLDQAVHLAVIALLWAALFSQWNRHVYEMLYIHFNSARFWAVATAYLLILKPTSILLGLFFSKWRISELCSKSLPNAGAWIGYLERILIVTFILADCPEGIGFLLAAKSIFRFGELNKEGEIKITEYVMIGTLASFTTAIVLGLAARQFTG